MSWCSPVLYAPFVGLAALMLTPDPGRAQFDKDLATAKLTAFFLRSSGGKEELYRSELRDEMARAVFNGWAENNNHAADRVTLREFVGRVRKNLDEGGPKITPQQAAQVAGLRFDSLDRNRDGLLSFDEMPEELRQRRADADANRDGFVSLDEFKSFARQQVENLPGGRPDGSNPGQPGRDPSTPKIEPDRDAPPKEDRDQPPDPDEPRRPKVHRKNDLPKELPAWFGEFDGDGDAQVGLYEWRAAGKPIPDFVKMDRNDDGLLTVDEVLRYAKGQAVKPGGESVTRAPARR